jgi:cytochrome c-type biogenesis protein CcmE
MTGEQFEAAWRLAREPVAAVVVGAWAVLGLLVVAFIVRVRTEWREEVKAGVALIAATVALGCLVWRATPAPLEGLQRVEQVVANPEVMRDRRLEVWGHVACGSIERRRGTNTYRFKIQSFGPPANVVLEARHTGLVPDNFRTGKLVVVRGTLGEDGVLDVVEGGIMVSDCAYSLPIYCAP